MTRSISRRTALPGLTAALCVALIARSLFAAPLGTAFTYQGRLSDGGTPANGQYDLELKLFDAEALGVQVGTTQTAQDVVVANGLFTIKVDFGTGVFGGEKRWLQIGVRPGASSGAFTPLIERQELTAAPIAQYAVSAGTVAGLTCTNGQVAKWSGTTWTCGADANSGGTVTSVAAGAGLSGGPISSSGTISVAPLGIVSTMIADGAVSSAKIANGAVGSAQINPAQVQARVTTFCPPGQFLRGLNADGSALCETFHLGGNEITTVDDDAVNNVGQHTSIAIGLDGFPVISYRDATAGVLKVAKCANSACSGTSTITTVDGSPNSVGLRNSIAVGIDGFPVISYADSTAQSLKVAKCVNESCTGLSTITTIDSGIGAGVFTSLAIGTDGFPIIAYNNFGASSLKVAKCLNAACTGPSTITTIETGGAGFYVSIAMGADGFPVMSYRGHLSLTGALGVVKCVDAACAGPSTISKLDLGSVPRETSIAVGADGFPIVSYSDDATLAFKVTKCANSACTAATATTFIGGGSFGRIAIGADGMPIISYGPGPGVTKCGNAACTVTSSVAKVDENGSHTSIAIGPDGLPVISYWNSAVQSLKVAKCRKSNCVP